MAVDPALLEEARRRGLIPPETPSAAPTAAPVESAPVVAPTSAGPDPALIEEAKRRGLIPSDEPSMFERAGQFVADTAGKAAGAVKDVVTGDSRRELDIPELPEIYTPQGMSGRAMSIGRDDLRKFDILRNATGQDIPGYIDSFGNVFVDIDQKTADALNALRPKRPDPRKLESPRDIAPAYWNSDLPTVQPGKYYINRPGVSGQDVQDAATSAAVEAAPAMLGAAGKGLVGVLGAAAGAGAGSAAQDVLAKGMGARQDESTFGVDPMAMLMNAGIGGGSEAVARLVAPYLTKLFRSKAYDPAKGFTPEAKKALGNLGINPDDLSPEWTQQFSKLARDNVDLEGAARYADAETLPVPVPLSKGDISRAVPDQSFESSAGKGSLGREAYDVMENFRNQQQQALKDNAEAIASRVGTGDAIPPLSGFQGAQARLADEATGIRQQAQKLYSQATDMGARVDADAVRNFADQARRSFAGRFGRSDQAKALGLLDELSASVTGAPGTKVTKTTIQRLEDFRGELAAQLRAAKGDAWGRPIKELKDQFDGFLNDVVEKGLMTGDQEALDTLKTARGLWRDLRTKYDNDGIVGMLIEFDPATKTYVPSLNPEGASRTLFNATDIGYKKGADRAAKALKETLGADSPEWLQLKQEAVMRLLRSQETGNVRDAAGNLTFSGDKFSTAFRKAMRESESLMKTLFTPEEISQLRQFERVALQATNRRTGAVNYSNSGEKMLQALDGFGNQVPGARWLLYPIRKYIKGASEGLAAAEARDATERGARAAISQARRLPAAARGIPAAVGVTGASTLPEQEKRRPAPQ